MVRTFCFSKNVVGQNWGVKEQADNLVRQLREALSDTDNFMVTDNVVMWKGHTIKFFFTENFGDTEKSTDLEETRFSEMSSIFFKILILLMIILIFLLAEMLREKLIFWKQYIIPQMEALIVPIRRLIL